MLKRGRILDRFLKAVLDWLVNLSVSFFDVDGLVFVIKESGSLSLIRVTFKTAKVCEVLCFCFYQH